MTKKEAEYLVAQMKSYLDQQLAAIDRRGKIDVHEFEKRYMTVSNGGCPVDHSLFRRFLNECAMGYGAINISVTEALPLEPDSNTLYILQQENGDVSLNVYVDGEWVTVVCSIENIISILYADLCTLRSESKLIPGSYYRITDYNTTTTQPDTQSAGHAFDIIVKALNSNSLSEEAYATIHEDDTYFENAKLEAWEIKYCINNDTSRFAWADSVNGKGVIYYMKDEWGNECPYDFKNIQFMKDSVRVYTFGGATDNSLTGGCHHNIMLDYVSSSVLTLNFNTFGNNCDSNTFGNNCHSNTFGDGCGFNTFGDWCSSNTFGDSYQSNTFGYACFSNTFGNECWYNTFGDDCYSNTFGDYCRSNTFGNNCYSNTFGDNCRSNTFGNNCQSNTFGDRCSSNTFGNICQSNTFLGLCYSNTFGNNCQSNTFGDRCDFNTFGNDCNSNTFGDGYHSNTFGYGCRSNTFGNYCHYNTFGKYCSLNTFGDGCNSNTFGNYCWSNNFYHGTSGTTKKDYIRYTVLEDGVRNNNFYSDVETSGESYLQRIRIKGLVNATTTDTIITLPDTNTKYEWLICYTSGGVLKQYCPNDLTNNYTYKIEDTSVSTWAASTAYPGYDYQAQINIADLSEADSVNVVFSLLDAISGNYAPAIEIYDGYILLFSKVNTEITIPTIEITKIDL